MTTHDTPEAGLERALERTEKSGYPGRAEWAAAVLAALDGWMLVPKAEAEYDPDEPEEAARLDAAARAYFAERRKEEAMQVVEWLREALHFDEEWAGIARSLVLIQMQLSLLAREAPAASPERLP